jgi:ribosomal protein S18 acetylase RimI-like enzyme
MSLDEKITLRPVTADDREFLLQVYAASREIELAMVPWDDAAKRAFVEHQFDAQRTFYDKEYKNVTHQIVLFDGEPAGRLYLSRGPEQTAIMDLTVLPEFRSRGIATHLIRQLQAESRPLRVFVESWNPSQKLFTKLGFSVVSQDESSIRLEWHESGSV